MDRRRKARCPGVVEQIAVFEIVVGMVMADEDVFHRGNRHAGGDQLPADAHAAINDKGGVVDDEQIGWIGSADADARATLGAEEHDPGAWFCILRAHDRRREHGGAAERQFQCSAAIDHGVPPADVFRVLPTLAAAQNAIKRPQADDDGGSDQRGADRTKHLLAGLADAIGRP
ncbi:hypothetical protein chiPu_0033188, partial [Chiloscyllium punctatum]|nr:hypothetical protein [Chiloscyllium punctatum]